MLRTIRYPVNLTNRISYGKAALAIGGRCHLSAAGRSLGAGHFPDLRGPVRLLQASG